MAALGQPDGDVAPTDQGSLVGRPVSDAVFRLVFRIDSRLHPSSLVWVPLNLTLDLCNNANNRDARLSIGWSIYLSTAKRFSPTRDSDTLTAGTYIRQILESDPLDVNPVADFPGRNSLEPNFGWSGSGEGRGALDDVLLSDSRCQGDHRGDV